MSGLTVFDKEEALERLANNEEMLVMLLKHFEKDVQGCFDGLQTLLAQQDFQQAHTHIHTLKGTAANLSLKLFSETCAAIDNKLRAEQLPSDGELANLEQAQRDTLALIAGL
ncbi:Hpt domain-containing protein [Catenovulum sp. SM1970]|uniref:Hpt domain-containing protein n=1 Tax=Marinifaba aquimaris TaxID=2741323 RepID=UPI001573C512|nr:Hpt domain-containing protein [Marinifaba aquimaris]NTS75846.1 Hpt domain-containing protein [Marinifaba aquimaris]